MLLAAGMIFALLSAAAGAVPEFRDGERVLFLGDSITRAGGFHGLIRLFYRVNYPERKIIWRNAGISGDSLEGALRRLDWDVWPFKPDTVVIMFGMNDIARPDLPGETGSDRRVKDFKTNLVRLITQLKAKNIRIILCTPSPYDGTAEMAVPGDKRVIPAMEKAAAFCRETAEREKIALVDFFTPMHKLNLKVQSINPAFTLIGRDRVHPGESGSLMMADLFLKAQGFDGITQRREAHKAVAFTPAEREMLKLLEIKLPPPPTGVEQKIRSLHQEQHLLEANDPRMLAFVRLFVLGSGSEAEQNARLEKLINSTTAKGNPVLGEGEFAQTMARRYRGALEKADANRKRSEKIEEEITLLLRKKESPANRERSNTIIPFSPEHFFNSINLNRRELRALKNKVEAKDYAGALDEYQIFLLKKLRNPASNGLRPLNPYDNSFFGGMLNAKSIAAADELLAKNSFTPSTADEAKVLAGAWFATGEQKYLDGYFTMLGRWASSPAEENIKGGEITDRDQSKIRSLLDFYCVLSEISRRTPAGKTAVNSLSLARILYKMARLYPAYTLIYHRSNAENWTPITLPSAVEIALLMDEWNFAAEYLRRIIFRFGSYFTLQHLPDGSETEHALWYNANSVKGAAEIFQLAQARTGKSSPADQFWLNPAWRQEILSRCENRLNFFADMLTPQKEYPMGNRSDKRRQPTWETAAMTGFAADKSSLMFEPVRFILSPAGEVSRRNFVRFPYSGSTIKRNSDSYVHFFSSPFPTGGHALQGMKNNNSFYVNFKGKDMLGSGSFGSYSYDLSPLTVDGMEQFFNAGMSNPGYGKNHKGFAVSMLNPALPRLRYRDNDLYTMIEGIYRGPYGFLADDHHDKKEYLPEFLGRAALNTINGVEHRRTLFVLKDLSLYAVIDRIKSASPHRYTLRYFVPVDPVEKLRRPYPASEMENIKITPDGFSLDGMKISFYGQNNLEFNRKRLDGKHLINDYVYRYRVYDFAELSAAFDGRASENTIITVIDLADHKARYENGAILLGNGEKIPLNSDGDYDLDSVSIDPGRTLLEAGEKIVLTHPDKEAVIRFTMDNTPVNEHSLIYRGDLEFKHPFRLRTRAYRDGIASAEQQVFFRQAELRNPLKHSKQLKPGLHLECFSGDWKDLLWYSSSDLKPFRSFTVRRPFERMKREYQRSVRYRYTGFLEVPADGIYTIAAPDEWAMSEMECGYEFSLKISGLPAEFESGSHGFGTWSIGLKKGVHAFELDIVDFRENAPEKFNHPALKNNQIFDGIPAWKMYDEKGNELAGKFFH